MINFSITREHGTILCVAFLFTICHIYDTWGLYIYIIIQEVEEGKTYRRTNLGGLQREREPRLGINPSEMLMQVLSQQSDSREKLAELKTGVKNLEQGQERLEKSLGNLGSRFDQKLLDIKDEIDDLRVVTRGYNSDRDERCDEHGRRLSELEHTKTMITGMGMASRIWLSLVVAVGGIVVGLLGTWLAEKFGIINL